MNIYRAVYPVLKWADDATHNVRLYRQEKATHIKTIKCHMRSLYSPIRAEIMKQSKAGLLSADINFQAIKLGVDNFVPNKDELDDIIADTILFLEDQGLNHTLNGNILTICWPDPEQPKNSIVSKELEKITELVINKN